MSDQPKPKLTAEERAVRKLAIAQRRWERDMRKIAKSKKRAAIAANRVAVKTKREALWFGDMNVKREARKLWKLLERYHGGRPMPTNFKIETHKGQRKLGHAYYDGREILLRRTGDVVQDWEVLAHELCHVAVKRMRTNGKKGVHDKYFYDALRHATAARWKTRISFYGVTKYGYCVDMMIVKQLREQGVVKFKPRPTKEEK